MEFIYQHKTGCQHVSFGESYLTIRERFSEHELYSFRRSSESKFETDDFDELGIQVEYNEYGACEAISFFEPAELIYEELNILNMSNGAIVTFLTERDKEVLIEKDEVTSFKLGIAVYSDGLLEYPEESIDSILVFQEGYYD